MAIINLFPSEIAQIDNGLFNKIGQFTQNVYSWPERLSSVFATKSINADVNDGPEQRQNILYCYLDIGDDEGEWQFLSPLFLYEDKFGTQYIESLYKTRMEIIVMEFRFFMSAEECSLLVCQDDQYIKHSISQLWDMDYLRKIQ